ncbi:hypothetical protein NC651_016917 [Populus alba x Populus x berolinensis]|nr:hypothetical protein NC651_016917 [Populus alba x Populus x berolinensis]
MKSAISSTTTLLSSKNLSLKLHLNHSPFSRLPSSLFRSKSNTHFPSLLLRNNSTHNQKSQIHTPVMASSFMPEQARAPPALPLPVPPVTKFKIGLCQLSVTADKERNIAHARKAIEEAAAKGAKLVMLPKTFQLMLWVCCVYYRKIWNSPYSNDSFPVYAEDIDAGGEASPSTAMLSEAARLLKITIVGGSIPERSGDRLYNTCCVFDSDGKLKAKHRKIHLFDIDIPGKITFIESKTLTAGETPTIVDTEVGRIGIGICYDIRFQELAIIYAARDRTLTVAAFGTRCSFDMLSWGIQHDDWTITLGVIAEGKLYVATCSPARDVAAGYVAWGHSTLVGPFGEVLATTEHEEDIIISEIDYSLLEVRRTNLPLTKQRRGDLYQLVDVQRLKSDS